MFCRSLGPWRLLLTVLAISATGLVAASVAPVSYCYALNKDNQLYDFTSWIGKEFPFELKDLDLTYVLRFCKDSEVRSGEGYVSYGQFSPAYFSASGSDVDFVQEYRRGDLRGCEKHGYDFSGRNTLVYLICGSCPGSSSCTDKFGCVCSVIFDQEKCMATITLAITCVLAGPRVLSGFTAGFSPRGKEVVENGITQWGYESVHTDYSFGTQQSRVYLYFTAPVIFASSIDKPSFKVYPEKGLSVQLLGTGAVGSAPTTESPTILQVDWRCDKTAADPYMVNVTVPVKDFDPVIFTLGKRCDYKQEVEKTGSNGWATFGVLSCIFTVMITMFCCAGFLYNTRVEEKHGLEALPGLGVVASCLDAASGDHRGYAPANEVINIIGPSRNGAAASGRGGHRDNYGAV